MSNVADAQQEAAAADAMTEVVVAEEADKEAARAAGIEARARVFGWKDKSEFDRPPERWVDAGEYLRRQETNLPVLKENLHRLEGMYGTTKSELDGVKADNAALRASVDHLRDLTLTAETRAFERAQKEIRGRIAESAKVADVPAVEAATKELAELKAPVAAPPVAKPTAVANAPDPAELAAVQRFTAENAAWFGEGKDEVATAVAVAEYGRQMKRAGLTPEARLAEARKAVEKRFPEHFAPAEKPVVPANPAASRPAAVATPSGAGGGSPPAGKDGGWSLIPADVRAAADKMIADVNKGRKDGKLFTRKEYAETYLKANPA